jgi:hypothetical protein
MDKDFMQYVYARCEKALTENDEFMELQKKCADVGKDKNFNSYEELSYLIRAKTEELCYIRGFMDGLLMGKGIQN